METDGSHNIQERNIYGENVTYSLCVVEDSERLEIKCHCSRGIHTQTFF